MLRYSICQTETMFFRHEPCARCCCSATGAHLQPGVKLLFCPLIRKEGPDLRRGPVAVNYKSNSSHCHESIAPPYFYSSPHRRPLAHDSRRRFLHRLCMCFTYLRITRLRLRDRLTCNARHRFPVRTSNRALFAFSPLCYFAPNLYAIRTPLHLVAKNKFGSCMTMC